MKHLLHCTCVLMMSEFLPFSPFYRYCMDRPDCLRVESAPTQSECEDQAEVIHAEVIRQRLRAITSQLNAIGRSKVVLGDLQMIPSWPTRVTRFHGGMRTSTRHGWKFMTPQPMQTFSVTFLQLCSQLSGEPGGLHEDRRRACCEDLSVPQKL